MGISRRHTLRSLMLGWPAAALAYPQTADQAAPNNNDSPFPRKAPEEPRLPNGKSQHDEIAREEHQNALKEAETLVTKAEELRDELRQAGSFVVPVGSLRKTEEIEKLARRIRGRLKQ